MTPPPVLSGLRLNAPSASALTTGLTTVGHTSEEAEHTSTAIALATLNTLCHGSHLYGSMDSRTGHDEQLRHANIHYYYTAKVHRSQSGLQLSSIIIKL